MTATLANTIPGDGDGGDALATLAVITAIAVIVALVSLGYWYASGRMRLPHPQRQQPSQQPQRQQPSQQPPSQQLQRTPATDSAARTGAAAAPEGGRQWSLSAAGSEPLASEAEADEFVRGVLLREADAFSVARIHRLMTAGGKPINSARPAAVARAYCCTAEESPPSEAALALAGAVLRDFIANGAPLVDPDRAVVTLGHYRTLLCLAVGHGLDPSKLDGAALEAYRKPIASHHAPPVPPVDGGDGAGLYVIPKRGELGYLDPAGQPAGVVSLARFGPLLFHLARYFPDSARLGWLTKRLYARLSVAVWGDYCQLRGQGMYLTVSPRPKLTARDHVVIGLAHLYAAHPTGPHLGGEFARQLRDYVSPEARTYIPPAVLQRYPDAWGGSDDAPPEEKQPHPHPHRLSSEGGHAAGANRHRAVHHSGVERFALARGPRMMLELAAYHADGPRAAHADYPAAEGYLNYGCDFGEAFRIAHSVTVLMAGQAAALVPEQRSGGDDDGNGNGNGNDLPQRRRPHRRRPALAVPQTVALVELERNVFYTEHRNELYRARGTLDTTRGYHRYALEALAPIRRYCAFAWLTRGAVTAVVTDEGRLASVTVGADLPKHGGSGNGDTDDHNANTDDDGGTGNATTTTFTVRLGDDRSPPEGPAAVATLTVSTKRLGQTPYRLVRVLIPDVPAGGRLSVEIGSGGTDDGDETAATRTPLIIEPGPLPSTAWQIDPERTPAGEDLLADVTSVLLTATSPPTQYVIDAGGTATALTHLNEPRRVALFSRRVMQNAALVYRAAEPTDGRDP